MITLLVQRHPAQSDQGLASAPANTRTNHSSKVFPLQRATGSQGEQRAPHAQEQNSDITLLVQRTIAFGHNFGRVAVHDLSDASKARPIVSEPGDKHEREADRAAEQIMRMDDAGEPQSRAGVSRAANEGGGLALHGAGKALDPEVRRFFESRFGYSFADVRVHSDQPAGKSARDLKARAYTIGRDIAFAPGEYRPESTAGRGLLAHELAHVVQQTRTPGQSQVGPTAAPLSRAPAGKVQRKLIATGDATGFAALANSVIAVQYEVVVSAAGEVSLRRTSVQGPLTSDAQELVSVLTSVINDSKVTTIEFIRGTTSVRVSDQRVLIGSYPQGKIDLDDIERFGFGVGQGITAGSTLVHEIQEQYRKQVFGEAVGTAHAAGVAAEERAAGATRGTETVRRISSTTIEIMVPYTYPDGRIVEVTFTVTSGNVTSVTRNTRGAPTP
jgi:hypothetical protein